MARPAVIVIGSINVDVTVRTARLPRPGETVLGGEASHALGGKGANQAVAAARAGREPVLMIAAVGDDGAAQTALANLERERIDVRLVRRASGAATGLALIMVDEASENLIAVAPGANARLTPDAIDAVGDDVWREAKVLLASLEVPLPTVLAALRRAKQAGLTTVLNPAPAAPEVGSADWLQSVDVVTPNETELVTLVGEEQPPGSLREMAKLLQERGAGACVVTQGARGCLVVEGVNAYDVPAIQVESVDTTGAGDALSGALAVALSEGQPLGEAVKFAVAAAALSVTKLGAQGGLASRAEIEALLAKSK